MSHPPTIVAVHDVPDKEKRNALVHRFVDQAFKGTYPKDYLDKDATFWQGKLDKNLPGELPTKLIFVAQNAEGGIDAAITVEAYPSGSTPGHALVGFAVRSDGVKDNPELVADRFCQLLEAAKQELGKSGRNVGWLWIESVRAAAGSPSAERSAVKMQAAEMAGLSMVMNADGEAHIHFEPSLRQAVADIIRTEGIEGLTQFFLHAIQLREDAPPLLPALLEFKKAYYQADGVDNSNEKPSMQGVLLAHTLGQVISGAYLASQQPTPPDPKRASSPAIAQLAA